MRTSGTPSSTACVPLSEPGSRTGFYRRTKYAFIAVHKRIPSAPSWRPRTWNSVGRPLDELHLHPTPVVRQITPTDIAGVLKDVALVNCYRHSISCMLACLLPQASCDASCIPARHNARTKEPDLNLSVLFHDAAMVGKALFAVPLLEKV